MEAVILAAGRGARLQSTDTPKCLLRVNGRSLLDYQLDALALAGVSRVVVCVGYRGDAIRSFLTGVDRGIEITVVDNPHYLTTNNSFTLALALRQMRECQDLLVINGDNLVDPRLVRLLVEQAGSALPYIVKDHYDVEDTKIALVRNLSEAYLTRIGKEIALHESEGESIGVRRFAEPFLTVFATRLEALVQSTEGRSRFFTDAIQHAVDRGASLPVLDVTHLCYAEVDFDHDIPVADDTASRMSAVNG